jgi:Domain of unknown function (DUF4365)
MPQRTREHEIGALAVTAVRTTLERAGYAIDEIKNDYGEDLLVQTHHKGHMDASRLWVQVKGAEDITIYRTSKKSRKDRFSHSVRFDSAMRWIRTIDLAIVVLWDVENDVGWYAVPRRQIDVWKGTTSGQKYVTLHFGKTLKTEPRPPRQGEFTLEAARRLAWESRFEHFHMLMLDALHIARWWEGEPSATGEEGRRKLVLIMEELLDLLDLTERDQTEPGQIGVKSERRQRAHSLLKALIYGEPIDGKVIEKPKKLGVGVGLIAGKVIAERLSEIDPDLAMPALLFGKASETLALLLTHGQNIEGESPENLEDGAW